MSMLQAAIQCSWMIYVAFFILLGMAALMVKGRRAALVSLGLVNNGGLMGLAAYLVMPFFSPFKIDGSVLVAAILIEIFCAAVFYFAAFRMIGFLRSRAASLQDRTVLLFLFLKVLFFVINYKASGGQYGIFSSDSRIDFLTISPTIAKLRYFESFMDIALVFSAGLRFTRERRITRFDIFGLAGVVVCGFMTGSKGGSLLLIFYIAMYLVAAYPEAFSYFTLRRILFYGVGAILACTSYLYTLSQVLGIQFSDLVSLSTTRLVLMADARIMAFDPNVTTFVLSHPHGSLLAELFRGVSRAIGAKILENSIGVYQFQAEFGTSNFLGSTNQLSAMFVTFGGHYAIPTFLFTGGLFFLLCLIFVRLLKSQNTAIGWTALASLYGIITTFCQGVDAFMQFVPICFLTIGILRVAAFFKIFGIRGVKRQKA